MASREPQKGDSQKSPKEICADRMYPTEAEEVSELIRHVVSSLEYYNALARRSELAKYMPSQLLDSIKDDPDSVLVARTANQRIIGFCISKYDDGLIWLSWFGVHPDYRGVGAAKALLSRFELTVRPRGCHKIWCDSRTTNEPSKAILRSWGYREICTIENHWYGQDFILWEKLVP